jgi:hypothetical protein
MHWLIERLRSISVPGLVLSALGTAVLTAFTTGLANVAWRSAGDLYDGLSLSRRVNDMSIRLRMRDELCRKLPAGAEFHNLITRYGVDDMFRDKAYATEQDQIDGQRQFLVKPASLEQGNGACYLVFELPVHAYLGTQFKIYATAKNPSDTAALEAALAKIGDPRCDYEPDKDFANPAKLTCVRRGGPFFEKIYFLLDKFPVVTTGGGVQNNYVPPA